MTFLRDLLRPSLRVVLAAICAAGVLHICITLASPYLSRSPAYAELTKDLAPHRMVLLEPVGPEQQPLPFMGPEAQYAACLFDAREGAVTVRAKLPAPGWVLSIYVPSGDNIYSAVAPPGRTIDVALNIVPTDDGFAELPLETDTDGVRSRAVLTVPARKGLVLVRAPDQGPAYRARNLAELRRAACAFTPRERTAAGS